MEQIYLDHAASTPVDPRVIAAMLPYWHTTYGNPSSLHHFGRQAARGLADARAEIAQLIGAQPNEIIFTASGSESDNLALRGMMFAAREAGQGNHLIVSQVEHPAVLRTAEQLAELHGFALTVVGVDQDGRVDPAAIAAAIRPDTVLITVMAANNEIGTVQPIAEIGALARSQNVYFHTDGIQAAGVTHWDLAQQPIDLLSLAPHKFYGPKGVGILYVRDNLALVSAMTGGGQEEGRRAGTVNVPFAVGAAAALRFSVAEQEQNLAHYIQLRDQLITSVLSQFPEDCRLTGCAVKRLPNHASFAFRHLSGNDLLIHLDMAGVAASSGSACSTGNPKPSPVLEAAGFGPEWSKGGLRLTVGKQNGPADIEKTAVALAQIVPTLQKLQAKFAG